MLICSMNYQLKNFEGMKGRIDEDDHTFQILMLGY